MRLAPDKLNGLLNDMGQNFLWRPSVACPCLNPQSGQPKTNCQNCDGKGRYWKAGVVGAAAAIGRNALKKVVDFGIWDQGDCMLSIPSDSPLYAMGLYDRVTALNRTEPFSQVFVYGVNDKLKFEPVSIDRVFYLDAQENEVECDIPTYDPVLGLVWGAVAPPAKKTYSMSGRRRVEYFCYLDLTNDRPHHYGRALPRRVQLRRFDLFGN